MDMLALNECGGLFEDDGSDNPDFSRAADAALANFVTENFRAKECENFQLHHRSRKHEDAYCFCGGTAKEHEGHSPLVANAETWKKESHIISSPTNAFGQIRFMPPDWTFHQNAQYVRLGEESDPGRVLELMTSHWEMCYPEEPQLVISLVGGAMLFRFHEKRRKQIFLRGLIRAVHDTRAWLLTIGSDVGIGRFVGDAVREGQSLEWTADSRVSPTIHCIGITPWGSLRDEDRLTLLNSSDTDFSPKEVWSRKKKIPGTSPLNRNHSHFLLVDDGHRNRMSTSWSSTGNRENGCTTFRAALERRIAAPKKEGGLEVPVVCLLVDGGIGSLSQLVKSAHHGVPCLICEGSGRAADLLAMAKQQYSYLENIDDEEEKRDRVKSLRENVRNSAASVVYPTRKVGAEVLELITDLVMELCQNEVVSVFKLEQMGDLDLAILSRLIDSKQLDLISQLNLALQWNRPDVANEKIFKDPKFSVDQDWKKMYPLMREALLKDQVEFVKVFVDHGVSMKNYLTVGELRELYSEAVMEPYSHLWEIFGFRKKARAGALPALSLADVYNVLCRKTTVFVHGLYSKDAPTKPGIEKFQKPFQELFIWAIFVNRKELAVYCWEVCEEPAPMAAVGVMLAGRLANAVRTFNPELRAQFKELKKVLSNLLVGLIRQAYETNNREKALLLIHRPSEEWDNLNTLTLAALANDKDFISIPCCQDAIMKLWRPGFEADGFRITVSALFVLPIFFLIHFDCEMPDGSLWARSREHTPSASPTYIPSRRPPFMKAKTEDWHLAYPRLSIDTRPARAASESAGTVSHLVRRSIYRNRSVPDAARESVDVTCDRSLVRQIPFLQKLHHFYSAPIVKFTVHTTFYTAFLLLYCSVVLYSYRPQITVPETLLYIWQLTLFFEEVRIVFCQRGHNLINKLSAWWHIGSFATWNRIDTLLILVSILAFSLRWHPYTFPIARLVLILGLIGNILRLFKVFFVNSYLGPKVVMFNRMRWDVGMFVLVLIVFLASFSVSAQALTHIDKGFEVYSIWEMFQRGIWEIFGEVNEDSMQGVVEGCPQNGTWLTRLSCDLRIYPIPILLTVYLVFGNILLINMLIAIFTHIFEDIQSNAEQIWKFQMYWVVMEHKEKPLFPAPLIVLEHLYLIGKWIRKKCSRPKPKGRLDKVQRKERIFLGIFEKVCRSDFLEVRRREEALKIESVIAQLQENVTKLQGTVGGLMSQQQQTTKNINIGLDIGDF